MIEVAVDVSEPAAVDNLTGKRSDRGVVMRTGKTGLYLAK